MIVNPLTESSVAFPLLLSLHVAGILFGVGPTLLLDFRLLGIGVTGQSAARLWNDTMPWTLGGFSLVIFTGLLLFSVNPDTYYTNHVFVAKMWAVLIAVAFHYTAVWWTAKTVSPFSPVIGALALLLWIAVLFGGIFIGSIGAGLNDRI